LRSREDHPESRMAAETARSLWEAIRGGKSSWLLQTEQRIIRFLFPRLDRPVDAGLHRISSAMMGLMDGAPSVSLPHTRQ
jgi:hypothetical protein